MWQIGSRRGSGSMSTKGDTSWGDIHDLRARNRHGRYVARVYRHEDGKRSQVTASGRTRSEARTALEEKMRAADGVTGVRSMDALADAYVAAATERGRPKPRTILEHQETYRRHIGPTIGKLDPRRLTRARVNTLLSNVPSPQHVDSTLRVLLDEAVMMGLVDENVARGAFKHAPKKVRPTALSDDKIAGLQAAFQAEAERLRRLDQHPDTLLHVFVVLRESGLRLGEALALRARDYDPATGRLTVAGTITQRVDADGKQRSWRQPSGKTDAATRTITLPPAADDGGIYGRVVLAERAVNAPDPDAPMFPARGGGFLHTHAFRQRWRNALARHAPDLIGSHPHELRHTIATHVVRGSVAKYGHADGKERARQQLGHASMKPLLAYLDRTDFFIDNSQVLAELNPQRTADARLADAVRETVAPFEVRSEPVGRIDGLPAFVLYGDEVIDAVAAVDERFVGAVLIVERADPRIDWVF